MCLTSMAPSNYSFVGGLKTYTTHTPKRLDHSTQRGSNRRQLVQLSVLWPLRQRVIKYNHYYKTNFKKNNYLLFDEQQLNKEFQTVSFLYF